VACLPAGILACGERAVKGGLRFQTAIALAARVAAGESGWLEDVVARLDAAWPGPQAPPVLMLPAVMTPDELAAAAAPGVPIGLEETRLAPLRVDLATGGPLPGLWGWRERQSDAGAPLDARVGAPLHAGAGALRTGGLPAQPAGLSE
jgi:hypothetical protein